MPATLAFMRKRQGGRDRVNCHYIPDLKPGWATREPETKKHARKRGGVGSKHGSAYL